jgi:ribonuclease HII
MSKLLTGFILGAVSVAAVVVYKNRKVIKEEIEDSKVYHYVREKTNLRDLDLVNDVKTKAGELKSNWDNSQLGHEVNENVEEFLEKVDEKLEDVKQEITAAKNRRKAVKTEGNQTE